LKSGLSRLSKAPMNAGLVILKKIVNLIEGLKKLVSMSSSIDIVPAFLENARLIAITGHPANKQKSQINSLLLLELVYNLLIG
jgi:hypothetical protein